MLVVEMKEGQSDKDVIENQLYEIDYLRNEIATINTKDFDWVDSGTLQIVKESEGNNWEIALSNVKDFIFFDDKGGDTAMVFMGESEMYLYYTMEV